MNSDLRVLLDTGFCLQLMRTAAGDVARALSGFQPGEIAVSALTEAELRARAQRSADPRRNLTALEQFLLPLQIVDFDQVAATRLATVNVLAAAQGIVPGFREIIAAQAIALNLPLITAMPAAYRHVAGLTVRGRLAESAPGTLGGLRAAESPQEITLAGSHDLIFDLLTTWLAAGTPARKMTLLPLGSLGGLLALQRGEAHIAGAHLLDTETGEYNSSYIRHLLTPMGMPTVLLGFVGREQGLIVATGNPLHLASLADLARPGVRFVNRQRGAGTRVLLDFHLHRQGVAPAAVNGYAREVATHLELTRLIAAGAADCGLGIRAAAQSGGLDFVPLFQERFDLVLPRELYESDRMAPLLRLIQRPPREFVRQVETLGGYDLEPMGKVLAYL
jgi:molybdate-binding protein/predicted nucleic acid-binding protein